MTRLPPQPWVTAAPTRRVMEALEAEKPGSARFVGGCVRNALLGHEVADIDIATQLTPDAVERVLRAKGMAVHPTGIEHGTLTVVADHHPFEVTTLRRDVETDGRRATVAFTDDWAEDAERRDFRINALYASLDGEVFDPTGGGLADIAAKRVVFVGDPETRLREDYLRILRFFRFYAFYGQGEPDAAGLAACARMKAGLKAVSVERVWMEMKKLLAAPAPMPALEAMAETGAFALLFPESAGLALLSDLVRLEGAQGIAPDPMLRFLALFGKDEPVVAGAARRLKMSNDERDRLVFSARFDEPLRPDAPAAELRRMLYGAGRDVVRDNLLLAWARDRAANWSAMLGQAASYQRPVMPVTGDDAMAAGVATGPDVGKALRALEQAWTDSDFSLSREALLKRL